MDRDIRKQAIPSGFPRRITSFATQESNGSISSSGSNDTFNSAESSPASSVFDSGSPGSSSPKGKERKDKHKSKAAPGSGVKFDQSLSDLTVNRLEIQHQPSLESLNESTTLKGKSKSKRPVVSCLKKPVSYSSFQSSNSDRELSSPTASSGSSSSSSSSKKRVTFKPNQQHFWDKAHHWIPFAHSNTEGEVDLEAQYGSRLSRTQTRAHEGPFTWSSISMFGHRVSWTKMFWTCLSGLNIAMLFIGLVLALMNLGDGVGTEAASLFLIVSCICMSTTVWAYLSRMDGDDDEDGKEEEEGLNAIKAQTANSERVGLLTGVPSSSNKPQVRSSGAASQGRWVRTRVMPVVTCVCLATVVTLNVMARAQ